MKEFFRGLGKLVRDLLDKFKKPKKQEKELTRDEEFPSCLSSGSIFIKSDDNSSWEYLGSIYGEGNTLAGAIEIPSGPERTFDFELIYDEESGINELEKYFSISRTLLPKRIPTKTLILSLAAHQQYDYQAVDMSQYEDRGIAHFIIGRTDALTSLLEEYLADLPTWGYGEEKVQEERAFFEETLRESGATDLFSVPLPNATLLHYEDLGIWSFEAADDEEDDEWESL